MADITRWEPFGDVVKFENEFEDLFRNFFRPMRLAEERGAMRIKLDVSEDEKSYTIKAELPGVRKEDIHVALDGNQVSISAETKQEKEERKGARVIRSERYYGACSRSFSLAHDIDDAASSAKYADGVLELRLPKKAGTETRKLKVD